MTDSPLSEQELQDIRKRCEKASAGPWAWAQTAEKGYGANVGADVFADEDELCDSPLSGNLTGQDGYDVGRSVCETFGQDAAPNADFIAASRSDIPKLLSELSRLRSERVTLAKDSERLDFIERAGRRHAVGTGWSEDVVSVEVFDDEEEPSQEWSVIGGKCLDGIGTAVGQGATLRAAIDRAMSESQVLTEEETGR